MTSETRGYFGIGVEEVSKAANAGAVMRTAHAFGASFCFTVNAQTDLSAMSVSDTSQSEASIPVYTFASVDALALPKGCKLVGIELFDDSIELPSFHHPRCAAYVLGSERGGLSPRLVERCDYLVKIPTRFSINLSLAGALVMYDRLISLGRFAPRPVGTGGPKAAAPVHVHGRQLFRTQRTEPR